MMLGNLKSLGMRTTLSYAAARLAARSGAFAYHRYLLMAVPRAGMPAMPRGFNAREIGADELRRLAIDASPDVQAARFGQGLACIGAFSGDELVGVNWLKRTSYDEDEVRVRLLLPADAAWDTGLWVAPERRLSRAFAALWAGTATWLAGQGLARSMSRIADYNLASINSHRRMGGVTLGSMAVTTIGGLQIAAGASPRLSYIAGAPAICDLRTR